jgi:murein L,D-transpeptidase YafK
MKIFLTSALIIIISIICSGCSSQSLNDNDNNSASIIEVYKGKQILLVKDSNHNVIKSYKCSIGPSSGKKHFKGDLKTPEGEYHITSKFNSKKTYKSLGISYPNADDIAYAKKHNKSPGGSICIHGFGEFNSIGKICRFVKLNLTEGCIAVSNEEMDELFEIIPIGTKVIICQ